MNHRPFSLLSASALRDIDVQGRAAMERWARDWLPAGAQPPRFEARRHDLQSGAPCSEGYVMGDVEQRFVWMPRAEGDVLASWLFPGATPRDVAKGGEVLSRVAKEAVGHLLRLLIGSPPSADGSPEPCIQDLPERCRCPSVALADLCISLGDATVTLIHAATPQAALKASGTSTCTPLGKALDQQTLTLRAELGEIEMDLRSLYALAEGDVIRLSARLDAPVPIQLEGRTGAPPIRGYLGAIDRHRALEIVAAN